MDLTQAGPMGFAPGNLDLGSSEAQKSAGGGNGFFPLPTAPTPHSRNTVVDLKSSCFIGSEDLFGSQCILTLVTV